MANEYLLHMSNDLLRLERYDDMAGGQDVVRMPVTAQNLPMQLEMLRTKITDDEYTVHIVLPRDQVQVATLDTFAPSRSEIETALSQITPLSMAELCYDSREENGQTHIAAIAKATLKEAAHIIEPHGFRLGRYFALPQGAWGTDFAVFVMDGHENGPEPQASTLTPISISPPSDLLAQRALSLSPHLASAPPLASSLTPPLKAASPASPVSPASPTIDGASAPLSPTLSKPVLQSNPLLTLPAAQSESPPPKLSAPTPDLQKQAEESPQEHSELPSKTPHNPIRYIISNYTGLFLTILLIIFMFTVAALAQAQSIRPLARQDANVQSAVEPLGEEAFTIPRPVARPASLAPEPRVDGTFLRPKIRPENFAITAQIGGITQKFRPRLRPAGLKKQSPFVHPQYKIPQNTDNKAEFFTPAVNTSAKVTDIATTKNVLATGYISLIGISGKKNARRAIIRFPNNRYIGVKVGDALDGGRVIRISDNTLQYVRGQENVTLKMP